MTRPRMQRSATNDAVGPHRIDGIVRDAMRAVELSARQQMRRIDLRGGRPEAESVMKTDSIKIKLKTSELHLAVGRATISSAVPPPNLGFDAGPICGEPEGRDSGIMAVVRAKMGKKKCSGGLAAG